MTPHRTRAVAVDAGRFDGTPESVQAFEAPGAVPVRYEKTLFGRRLAVETPDGTRFAEIGDGVVTTEDGRRMVVPGDLFGVYFREAV